MFEKIKAKLEGYKSYIIAGFWLLAELVHLLGLIDDTMIMAIRAICAPALGITFAAKINRQS